MKKTSAKKHKPDRPIEFRFRCVRSSRPEHQCVGLKAQYGVEGSVHEMQMEHAYRSIEQGVLSFMQAIPGVYVLTVWSERDRRVWEFDFRPAAKTQEVIPDATST